eukprot:794025-Rhodomonas_salina.1
MSFPPKETNEQKQLVSTPPMVEYAVATRCTDIVDPPYENRFRYAMPRTERGGQASEVGAAAQKEETPW